MLKITDKWSYKNFKTVILENDFVKVTIVPEIGARIFEFIDKENNIDLLWHHPRNDLRQPVFGNNCDDWWTGGIDDVFPTDFPCEYRGEKLPYLGEVWSVEWEYEITKKDKRYVEVHLYTNTIISPFKFEKWVGLGEDKNYYDVKYKITNIGYEDYEYYFGIHPSLYVEKGFKICIPIKKVFVDSSFPNNRLGKFGSKYIWPNAKDRDGKLVDMSIVPSLDSRTWDFHYGTELREGWLALINPKIRNGYAITFDENFFKNTLMYFSYGGWRYTSSIILQIGTGYPAAVVDAIKFGNQKMLKREESISTNIKFHIIRGYLEVDKIDKDLKIVGKK
mgnify:CR=1 FL=1